jgi:hypothetical protein
MLRLRFGLGDIVSAEGPLRRPCLASTLQQPESPSKRSTPVLPPKSSIHYRVSRDDS